MNQLQRIHRHENVTGCEWGFKKESRNSTLLAGKKHKQWPENTRNGTFEVFKKEKLSSHTPECIIMGQNNTEWHKLPQNRLKIKLTECWSHKKTPHQNYFWKTENSHAWHNIQKVCTHTIHAGPFIRLPHLLLETVIQYDNLSIFYAKLSWYDSTRDYSIRLKVRNWAWPIENYNHFKNYTTFSPV